MAEFQKGDRVVLDDAGGTGALERAEGREGTVEIVGVKANEGYYQVQFEAFDGWEDPQLNHWVDGDRLEPAYAGAECPECGSTELVESGGSHTDPRRGVQERHHVHCPDCGWREES